MEGSEQGGQSMQAQKPVNEVNITYETLFEILRIEKNRDDLQEIPATFFEDVVAYLREKQQILDEGRAKEDLFSATEREKTSTEMGNVKKILRELYERREKKIINMALNKSRTMSNIIDTSKLVGEESRMFGRIVETLDSFRGGILTNLLDLRIPYVEEKKNAVQADEKKEDEEKKPEPVQKDAKLVRFLHPVPKFVGKELEVYGPFEEEDMATLPTQIADVLISKGRAEEISEG